ncbi:hypothetical protein LAZ67_3001731 [Cordylochernes scorpioides]|uniref:CCHC-type domain-containing protein n=1 Tax=Cordylochernes scorpioides TaxID=51811 RepID=A0ABY6KAE7_9ARAC|nr:hypothetical protein LAZ67_3001731 [Cordylochernes scorpioides]
MDNPQQSTREMSARLGPSKDTINRTLHKLHFVSKHPRQDPHDLTIAQSQRRVDICKRFLKNPQDLWFWKWIVTGDEKWIYLRNPDTKRQWVPCDQEVKPVVKQDRFGHNVMLSVWGVTSMVFLLGGTGPEERLPVIGVYDEVVNPGTDDDFTVVKTKKRRRESSNSPTAATPSSNSGRARSGRRVQSSARSVPRAQEIPTTRAHIAEARARQTSSTEDHCVYIERSPELEPYHYMRALDRMLGGTREVFQMTKMNGHFLVGLANRGLAERLVNEGLEVEGTLHRAFPFRKRAERITVGNLPFFVGDAAVISALSPFGRVTSIAPKLMKAGPYVYNDGRREAFIILREGMTIERLPTRLDITIKGEAWPAYLSSGIRCSRCRGQGHRRANCPMLAGRTTAPGPATPTSPTSVPPATAPRLPQQPSAQPPPPASPSSTMEVSDVPPASRAAPIPPAALRPSPPAPSALPAEDAPPAPPPVTPALSLRTPGSREPAAPTPDVEMSIVEEFSASSTSSAKNATRVDLDAFIEKHPSVSFAGTDALGLGREEVLDLLSSRTKAQRKGPLLSPPQCDAFARLIGQILDLRPGAASNLYKVLGQVKAELRTTPTAVSPTPPLPAPRPAEPTPPAPHGKMTTPAMTTSPSPLFQVEEDLTSKRWDEAADIIYKLCNERYSIRSQAPQYGLRFPNTVLCSPIQS